MSDAEFRSTARRMEEMMRTFVDWTQHEAQVRLEERALLAAVVRDTRELRSDFADLRQEIRSSGATTPFGRNCILISHAHS